MCTPLTIQQKIVTSTVYGLPNGGAYIHQYMTWAVLRSELSSSDLSAINEAHAWIDSKQFQSGAWAPLHAMRSSSQSPREACLAANRWVNFAFQNAISANANGNRREAMFWFGAALHTMQDSTSPAHEGFQLWEGNPSGWEMVTHAVQESRNPGTNSAMGKITKTGWQYFNSNTVPTQVFACNTYPSEATCDSSQNKFGMPNNPNYLYGP